MKRSRLRAAYATAAVLLGLAAAWLAGWQTLVDRLLLPLATVLWLLLRITVLAVPQQVWWYALVLSAVGLALARLPRGTQAPPPAPRAEENLLPERLAYWRTMFDEEDAAGKSDERRQALADLLTGAYATGPEPAARAAAKAALASGAIPLPAIVHNYLFAPGDVAGGHPLARPRLARREQVLKLIGVRAGRGDENAAIEQSLACIEAALGLGESDARTNNARTNNGND